jgi:hypothetical protein
MKYFFDVIAFLWILLVGYIGIIFASFGPALAGGNSIPTWSSPNLLVIPFLMPSIIWFYDRLKKRYQFANNSPMSAGRTLFAMFAALIASIIIFELVGIFWHIIATKDIIVNISR